MRYAHVMSVVAIVVATGGSAYAATVYTSKQIKDGSLTAVHVKNRSLKISNVAAAARTQLKIRGSEGPQGPQGAPGDQGQPGLSGEKGTAAHNAYAFARNINDGVAKVRTSDNIDGHWYSVNSNYGSGSSWRDIYGGYATVDLELASGTNDGLLQLEWDSDVIANAHVLLWHHGTVHTRIECRMQIWQDQAGAVTNVETIGTPVTISSDNVERNVNIGLTGAITRTKGTHGVRVQCRDLDFSTNPSYQNWRFIKGNLSVVSAKTWS